MKYLIFTLILFLTFSINAQRVITGKVVDEDSCAMQNIGIRIEGTRNIFRSDSNGCFELEVNKNQKVIFTYAGFKFKIIEANQFKNDTIIIMEKNDESSDDVLFGKPVIYLYPEKETIIDIKLEFNGEILNTYPDYSGGWQVLAKPNGDLINQKDNSLHKYLFWDGIYKENLQIDDFETGFVVKNDEVLTFLDSNLTKIGLNQYEKNDFITFWMPIMKNTEYNLVHFLISEECNKIATLDVNPKPDSEIRVYILFKEIDKPVNITPQILETADRNGFVLVEWGGTVLNTKGKIE